MIHIRDGLAALSISLPGHGGGGNASATGAALLRHTEGTIVSFSHAFRARARALSCLVTKHPISHDSTTTLTTTHNQQDLAVPRTSDSRYPSHSPNACLNYFTEKHTRTRSQIAIYHPAPACTSEISSSLLSYLSLRCQPWHMYRMAPHLLTWQEHQCKAPNPTHLSRRPGNKHQSAIPDTGRILLSLCHNSMVQCLTR